MRNQNARPRSTRYIVSTLLFLACLLGSAVGRLSLAADIPGPCEPSLARRRGYGLPIVTVATQPRAETSVGLVGLEWLGHSSFLLTSPVGLRLLTDPNTWHPIPTAPDVVTVSNLHITHSGVSQVPGTPQVLWGLTPDRGWNNIVLTREDVTLFNLPSYVSHTDPENSPIQNSIFVFRTGGLCIVHLGNLRHPLTPPQLQRLGKPDVLLIPGDGQWTLLPADILTVVAQLQPLLVIPMHFDFLPHAEVFVQYFAGRYPVRRVDGRSLTLSRQMLPASTEVVIFKGP
jgi:L-ascorbate metabolism protein UlaG (beta-lactamase superfamily)